VVGDEGKLRQVLVNLVGNAFKFTASGRVDVRVRRSGEPTAGAGSPAARLTFEVADTGRGIEPEELSRLFEPFEQAGQGAIDGAGLGLSISRSFVALMGGQVTVASRPGEGSTFTFDVVFGEHEPADGPARGRGSVVCLAPDQSTRRILVVDDQWENRELLVRLLASVGFEVRGAENGRQAIEVWEAWEPHLVWMDMRMPVLDGYAATRHIKGTLRGQATVVIALTASAFEHDRAMILSVGCDDFVRKPVKESELFDKLEAHLGVRFVYSSEDAPGADPVVTTSALPLDLRHLPEAVRGELRAAAEQLNGRAVGAILQRLRATDAPLSDGLGALVSAYRFDAVLALLDEADGAAPEQGAL
jgi:CheY-like chemotaxis protein